MLICVHPHLNGRHSIRKAFRKDSAFHFVNSTYKPGYQVIGKYRVSLSHVDDRLSVQGCCSHYEDIAREHNMSGQRSIGSETMVPFEKDTESVSSSRLHDTDNTVMNIGLYCCLFQNALCQGKTWANRSGRKNTACGHYDLCWLELRWRVQPRSDFHVVR